VLTRFLIVRLGALGDIVHAIPVAAALRRAFPTARIDWLVSGKHRDILDLVPVIDRSLAVKDRGGRGGGESLFETIRGLRETRYDVALDLQADQIRGHRAAVGAARVIGFNGRYARESLARLFYTDVHDPGGEGIYAPSETRHVVEINLGLLAPLGITDTATEFPIDARESAIARTMTEQTGGRYALLNPGAAWPNKRWPPARLAALAAALRERRGLPSVIIWGPGEYELAEDVVTLAGGAAILSPQTAIADVVALARGAAAAGVGDTGPTHLAAAVGTPLVGIYGPTRPERNGPGCAMTRPSRGPRSVSVITTARARRRKCACSTSRWRR
jgi:ADP-heptose:LPS heptosyltransferase